MSKDLAMKENERQLQDVQWDLHEVEESKPLEFTEINNVDLFGIEPVKAKEMINGLSTTLAERQVLKDAYADVIALEITTENLPTFKELRLKIMKNRTQGLTKWKEKEKAFYLAGGNFIQAIYNKEVAVNEEMEAKLMEAEKFFENQEKERLAVLKKEREELLQPFVETLPNDLETLDQDVFDSFLETKKKAHAEKLEAARLDREAEEFLKKELEREQNLYNERKEMLLPYWNFILDSDKDRNWGKFDKETFENCLNIYKERKFNFDKEQEAQRLENERLKKEAEDKEKALQKERAEAEAKQKAIQDEADKKAREEKAKQDAILKAEQEAKAKLEAELQAKKDAEIKAENERIAKEKAEKDEAEKLAKAPIKKQLSVWVNSFEIPAIGIDNNTSKEIKEKFEAFKKMVINTSS